MPTKTEYSLELTFLSNETGENVFFSFPNVKSNVTAENINTIANYMIENPILFNKPLSSLVEGYLVTKTLTYTDASESNYTRTVSTQKVRLVPNV